MRALRRPLLVLTVGVLAVALWLGLSPGLTGPASPEPVAVAAASPTAVAASAAAAGPNPTTRPAPTPTAATAPTAPPASPASPASPAPVSPSLATPLSATAALTAALDVGLERLRAKAGIPGISAAILFPDGTIWQGTAGLADVATSRPVTADTAFPIASVSKTFTAALILGLVQDGRLSLDSSAKAYLPTLRIDPAITIRELLDHTSGLRDFYFGAGVDKALLSKPARVWDAARSLRYLGKPYAKPGTSWHYSNTNYLLLGLVAESVGGAPVATQLRERFFKPLGLVDTYYQAVERPIGPVAQSYQFTGVATTLPAIPLTDGSAIVPFTSVVTAAGAAGSIATSAGDLVHWAQDLYGGSALGASVRSEMTADILRTRVFKPAIGYGLGVQFTTVDGRVTLGHSGRFLGARAVMRWLPTERIAIAVLTNQSRSDPARVLAALLKTVLVSTPP